VCYTAEIYVLWRTAILGVQNPPCKTSELLKSELQTSTVQTDTSTNYGYTTGGSFAGIYHSPSYHMVTGNVTHMQKAMTS